MQIAVVGICIYRANVGWGKASAVVGSTGPLLAAPSVSAYPILTTRILRRARSSEECEQRGRYRHIVPVSLPALHRQLRTWYRCVIHRAEQTSTTAVSTTSSCVHPSAPPPPPGCIQHVYEVLPACAILHAARQGRTATVPYAAIL